MAIGLFPSGDVESLKCVDPTEATAAADFIASKLQNPKACMSKYLEVNRIVTEINSDLECCLSAVVGVESWDNGYSMKSTQPCENDDQCESGKCLIAGKTQKKTYRSTTVALGPPLRSRTDAR